MGKIEALPGQLPTDTRCLVLVLANVNPQPMGLIRRSGVEAELGAEHVAPTVEAAVLAAGLA